MTNRVEGAGYSLWEYFFWLIHYYKEPEQYDIILMKNLVCSDKLWEPFLEWKADARRFARVQMEIHTEEAQVSSRLRPLPDVLLDPNIAIGPVARVEIALQTEDPQPVIEAYAAAAGDVLRGMPEFIEFAPELKKYLEMPNVPRQFLPCPA